MADRLAHRGPDEEGSYLSEDGRCAIGFRRLSVIDPPGSHQPMSLPGGAITVAFNGEIYNFRELRGQLAADGARFVTAGDTEVLLHMYLRYGAEMVEHLCGMFAFAIHDARKGELLLVRDRLGQKPLWYAALPDRIVFSSEAKGLLVHPHVDTSLDMLSIQHFLTLGYIPAPRTAWNSVRKLLPGNMISCGSATGEPERYWRPESGEIGLSGADLVREVREKVAGSVEARMVSDVPLGGLLSGGVDSAIIVALMSRAAGSGGGVRTFTAGFDQATFDERNDARVVAEHCGTEHRELLIRPAPVQMLDELVTMYDEPFADSSALPMWLICRAAREHVKVALVGDGGDEVFGGYDRYRAVHLGATMSPAKYMAVKLGAWMVGPWAPHEERSRLRRLIRFADGLPLPPAMQYFSYRAMFDAADLDRLFRSEFAAERNLDETAEWFCELYEREDLPDEVARAQLHDMLTYLPDDLLVKADIASMAASLELRAPMLDHSLVSTGLSLPLEMKVSHGRGKAILREAFGDLLPAEVFTRPKRGFGVPLGEWLRDELRETLVETLTDRSLLDRGIFEASALAGLVNDHLSGRDDHRHRLWALLVLGRWLGMQG